MPQNYTSNWTHPANLAQEYQRKINLYRQTYSQAPSNNSLNLPQNTSVDLPSSVPTISDAIPSSSDQYRDDITSPSDQSLDVVGSPLDKSPGVVQDPSDKIQGTLNESPGVDPNNYDISKSSEVLPQTAIDRQVSLTKKQIIIAKQVKAKILNFIDDLREEVRITIFFGYNSCQKQNAIEKMLTEKRRLLDQLPINEFYFNKYCDGTIPKYHLYFSECNQRALNPEMCTYLFCQSKNTSETAKYKHDFCIFHNLCLLSLEKQLKPQMSLDETPITDKRKSKYHEKKDLNSLETFQNSSEDEPKNKTTKTLSVIKNKSRKRDPYIKRRKKQQPKLSVNLSASSSQKTQSSELQNPQMGGDFEHESDPFISFKNLTLMNTCSNQSEHKSVKPSNSGPAIYNSNLRSFLQQLITQISYFISKHFPIDSDTSTTNDNTCDYRNSFLFKNMPYLYDTFNNFKKAGKWYINSLEFVKYNFYENQLPFCVTFKISYFTSDSLMLPTVDLDVNQTGPFQSKRKRLRQELKKCRSASLIEKFDQSDAPSSLENNLGKDKDSGKVGEKVLEKSKYSEKAKNSGKGTEKVSEKDKDSRKVSEKVSAQDKDSEKVAEKVTEKLAQKDVSVKLDVRTRQIFIHFTLPCMLIREITTSIGTFRLKTCIVRTDINSNEKLFSIDSNAAEQSKDTTSETGYVLMCEKNTQLTEKVVRYYDNDLELTTVRSAVYEKV